MCVFVHKSSSEKVNKVVRNSRSLRGNKDTQKEREREREEEEEEEEWEIKRLPVMRQSFYLETKGRTRFRDVLVIELLHYGCLSSVVQTTAFPRKREEEF